MPGTTVPPNADALAMGQQWEDEGTMAEVAALAEHYPELLAGRLSSYRKQHDLTIDALAAYLGLSRLNLYRLATCYVPHSDLARLVATRDLAVNEEHLTNVLAQTTAAGAG